MKEAINIFICKGEMIMKNKAFTVPLTKNPVINMNVIPGHFTTSHFHISHYLDLENLKTDASVARDVAIELALPYLTKTLVDTIVCMEGTEVIGAFLAEELLREGTSVINSGKPIHVITPISNIDRKLMFQSNLQEQIYNRNILLLVSTISSGTTVNNALECLNYYGGRTVGISALFSANPDEYQFEFHSMFTNDDIPDYNLYTPGECPLCKQGKKLEAIIMHDGYTEI